MATRFLILMLLCCGLYGAPSRAADAVCNQPLSAKNIPGIAEFIWAGCPQQLNWPHDATKRMSGPQPNGTKSVHGFVYNYYAPSVYAWLKAESRAKTLPDGALIIKEMYADDGGKPGTMTGWTIMVKQADASFDGWFWGFVDPRKSQGGDGASGGQFYDPNCVSCHASANNAELTYSALENIAPRLLQNVATAVVKPSASGMLGGSNHARINLPSVGAIDNNQTAIIPTEVPPQSASRVLVGPQGRTGFATADVCSGCHDASNLALGVQAHMTWPQNVPPAKFSKTPLTNFSPYAEWSASLMGLAGRDPVFQAQRESETRLYPEIADVIDNTCYTCHGVMGKRQKEIAQPGALFTHADFLATSGSNANVGGLARDGVSCLACHRMTSEGLGTRASFTGNFKVADPSTVFGPYNNVAEFPMKNSLGMTPKPGSAIHDAAMCGSCHVVETPILDARKKYDRASFNAQKKSHEQTTYLEWLNSTFQNKSAPLPGATPQTCQDCHMPRHINGHPITTAIANIEDNTYVDALGKIFPNTAPPMDITLTPRDAYGRHTFVGANFFVLEMFRQFGTQLGLPKGDPNYDTNTFRFVSKFDLVTKETNQQVKATSARVAIVRQVRSAQGLEVTLQIENLTGHKFPSGVGFRRAFVEFTALDANGQTLWRSGGSNAKGEIVNTGGNVLATEYSKTAWQPHHKLISRDDAVQIYETRSKDPAGLLTTSFLALASDVKDNRLMPRGWRPSGPYAEWTRPIAVAAPQNAGYYDGRGVDSVTYRVPTTLAGKVARVRATLNYQSIPPYYLKDRFEIGGNGPSTATLKALVSQVDYRNTPAEGWKIQVSRAEAATPKLSTGR